MELNENQECNNSNTLVGTILTKSVIYKIKILELDKPVPLDEVENLKEWLESKSTEVGIGRQHEHFGYTDNYQDDIGVSFVVSYA